MRANRSTRLFTHYYCRSLGCKMLPGVKRPRPIWTAFGMTLEQERAYLLARVAEIDRQLHGQTQNNRGSGGECAR